MKVCVGVDIMTIFFLLAGLAVYGFYGLSGLAFLAALTAGSYLAGRLIPRFRWVLWAFLAFCVGWLAFIRLEPITHLSLLAPLGISYFSLKIISYLCDVYRGKYAPAADFFHYALYVTWLPGIFLGPIERYDRFAPPKAPFSWENFSTGGVRILWGLFKKLVIAARAGVVVGAISAGPEEYRGAYVLLALLLYSVQLYADFSGGIDMVLGLSQMLGVRLCENFDRPYFSQSVAEFWRRWHMSLGAFLRDYVYIPLGGSRKGKLRKLLNTVLTFLVSGLWHGVHYLLWGVVSGLLVWAGDRLKTPIKLLNQIFTFLLITLLWAFFVWPDTGTALTMLGSLTTLNYGNLIQNFLNLGLNVGEWVVLVMSTCVLWVCDGFLPKLRTAYASATPAKRTAVCCALGLVVLVFGMYGLGFNAGDFIYSRF